MRDAKLGKSAKSGFMASRTTAPGSIPRCLMQISENPGKAVKALVRRQQSNFARYVLVRPIFDPIAGSAFGEADGRAGQGSLFQRSRERAEYNHDICPVLTLGDRRTDGRKSSHSA